MTLITSAAPAGHGLLPPGSSRRGRLKNGARPGDFLAALHGGLSTGPRTAEGRARCAAARRTHGAFCAATVALRREAAARCRRTRALLALVKGRVSAGHGVLPRKSAGAGAGRPGGAAAIPATAGHEVLPSASRRPAPARPAPSPVGAPRRATTVQPAATAGHGVLPSDPAAAPDARRREGPVQRALRATTALGLGVTVPPPFAAGHGVLLSDAARRLPAGRGF
jgi:hypothetical protein